MTDKLTPLQENLLSRADSIFGSISTAVGQAKDLAVEQLPDIAYQYILFNRAYITFMVLASIALITSFQYFYIRITNKHADARKYDKGEWGSDQIGFYVLGTGVSSLLGGIVLIANLRDFFMVWFAPKIFLIEHLVTLIKR